MTSLVNTETYLHFRGGSRTAATSKIEFFVIIVNGLQPLTIITKHSILDVGAAIDPLLMLLMKLRIFVLGNTTASP